VFVRQIPRVETGCMSYLIGDRSTTLGKERRSNRALTVKSKEDFIRSMLEGWPPKPIGWREISERNMSL
jgi:hypothetical protein